MKLTLLELVFPKRAIKRLQIKDDVEYARFKSDMNDFERKITKSGISLTPDEVALLKAIENEDDAEVLSFRLGEMETTLRRLKEGEEIGRKFADEVNEKYEEYINNLKHSHDKAHLLFDVLAKRILVISTIILLGGLIVVYIYYKIYNPEFGMGVTQNWYMTVAQILPALLIALFLTGNSKEEIRNDRKSAKISVARSLLGGYKFIGLFAFVIGEAACLMAIERGFSGTGVYVFALSGLWLMGFTAFARILGIDSNER